MRPLIRELFLSPSISCGSASVAVGYALKAVAAGEHRQVGAMLASTREADADKRALLAEGRAGKPTLELLVMKFQSWPAAVGPLSREEREEFTALYGEALRRGDADIFSERVERPHSPDMLYRLIDRYVIGQEEAKRTVCFSFYLHLVRCGMIRPKILNLHADHDVPPDLPLPNPNILLIGLTGCGKTYLVSTLCKLLGVQTVTMDCSSLTSAGYIGLGVNEYMEALYDACGGDAEAIGRSVVYLDEFDKLSTKGKGDLTVKGATIQQELLKLVESDTYTLQRRSGQSPKTESVEMDISTVMFVFSSSFAGMEEQFAQARGIRFGGPERAEADPHAWLKRVGPEDLIKFGLIPELVGRINFIVALDPLTREDIVTIMRTAKGSALERYENFFRVHLDELSIDEEVYDLLADEILARGGGGRSITSCLQQLLADYLYDAPNLARETFHVDVDYFRTRFPSAKTAS